MSEEDATEVYVSDAMCERAQAVRDIAFDLETRKNKKSRELLVAAANAVLLSMTPPRAEILKMIPGGKGEDEREAKPL